MGPIAFHFYIDELKPGPLALKERSLFAFGRQDMTGMQNEHGHSLYSLKDRCIPLPNHPLASKLIRLVDPL